MRTLHVTPGNLHKLTKFEGKKKYIKSWLVYGKKKNDGAVIITYDKFISVEAGMTKPGKLAIYERDVALAVLYGNPCIILLRHQPGTNRSSGTASVYVYTVHKYAF